MMPSPESYVAQLEGRPYSELIAARESLLADLHEQEAAFRNPGPEPCEVLCPSPGVVYTVSLQYLVALCDHMARRAQPLTGEPDLYADEEGCVSSSSFEQNVHRLLSRLRTGRAQPF